VTPAAAQDRRRPRLGCTRLAPGHRTGRDRDRATGAGRLRQDPGREAGGRVDPAAQAVGVLQRARLRGLIRAPRLEPGRPDPVDRPAPRRALTGRSSSAPPRPGRGAPGRRRAAGAVGRAPEGVFSAASTKRRCAHRAGILKWQVRMESGRGGRRNRWLPRSRAVGVTAPTAPVRGLFLARPCPSLRSSVGRSASVRSPRGPRNPVPTDAWRTAAAQNRALGRVRAGWRGVARAERTGCKTVGLAYDGSNPSPATTAETAR
jgi:hypothetical protein